MLKAFSKAEIEKLSPSVFELITEMLKCIPGETKNRPRSKNPKKDKKNFVI